MKQHPWPRTQKSGGAIFRVVSDWGVFGAGPAKCGQVVSNSMDMYVFWSVGSKFSLVSHSLCFVAV